MRKAKLKTGPVFLSRALWGAAVVLGLMATEQAVPPSWLPREIEPGVVQGGVWGQVTIWLLIPMAASIWLVHLKKSRIALRLTGFASIAFVAMAFAYAALQGWMGILFIVLFAPLGLAGVASFWAGVVLTYDLPYDWAEQYHPQYGPVMGWFGVAAVGSLVVAAGVGPWLLLRSGHAPEVAWSVAGGLLAVTVLLSAAMDRALHIFQRDGGLSVPKAVANRFGW